MTQSHNARGNMLFLILLAIILFAALAYAVTGALRGGGKDSSSESAQAQASAIVGYFTLLRNEIDRMRLVNGCEYDNINWLHNTWRREDNGNLVGNFYTAAQPKSGCSIFAENGGAVPAMSFKKAIAPDFAPTAGFPRVGDFYMIYVNMVDAGTSGNDLTLWLLGVKLDVCLKIMQSYDPTKTAIYNDQFSTGTSTGATITDTLGDTVPLNGYNGMNGIWMDIENNTYCNLGYVLFAR